MGNPAASNSEDVFTYKESSVRFVPVTLASQNPLECCNLKLHKALKFLTLLFIICRGAILTFYLHLALHTACFLQYYADNWGSNGIFQYTQEIQVISTLFWVKEAIFILSTFLLLFVGATYRKYEFLKCWLIFTCLHEVLGLMAQSAIGFCMWTPLLAFHLPLSLPFLALIIWLTLRLMREIKAKQIRDREEGPHLKVKKRWAKGKHLYRNSAPLPLAKPEVFIQSENSNF